LPASSALDFLVLAGPHLVYAGIFLLLVLSALGLPFPEDLTLLAAGYLIHRGVVAPVPAALAGILGVLSGDSIAYAAGRRFGPRIVSHRWFSRFVSGERFERAAAQFHRHGEKLIFFARFVSLLRAPVFLTAGTLRMRPARFLLYDAAAAGVSVPLLLFVGRSTGPHLETAPGGIFAAAAAAFLVLLGIGAWVRRRAAGRGRSG
jgi:membrane protein DedA with SNARE-associated domain